MNSDTLTTIFGSLFAASTAVASQPIFNEQVRTYAGLGALLFGSFAAYHTNKPVNGQPPALQQPPPPPTIIVNKPF